MAEERSGKLVDANQTLAAACGLRELAFLCHYASKLPLQDQHIPYLFFLPPCSSSKALSAPGVTCCPPSPSWGSPVTPPCCLSWMDRSLPWCEGIGRGMINSLGEFRNPH